MYSIQAHDGAVLSLAHSPSYVVSMGSDEKLCVWERFHGHLINTINLVSNIFTISIKHFIKSNFKVFLDFDESNIVIYQFRLAVHIVTILSC